MQKYPSILIYEFLFKIYTRCYNSVTRKNTIFSEIFFLINYRYVYRLQSIFLTVFLLAGSVKNSKEKISVLYVGNKESLYYLSKILFFKEPKIEILNKVPVWRIKNVKKHYLKNVDITISNTDRFFSYYLQKKGFFIIPEWISMELDITQPLETIVKNFKKSAKEDINKIIREGYTYEITKDIVKFNYFFYEIRQKYFCNRVGKQALPGSERYEDIKITFRNGLLFLVKKNNEYVSGFLVKLGKKIASPHFMGILEKPYFEKGAGSALIYFFIKWAKEKNLNVLLFGNTRSFLNDGAFQFKRKWNMTLKKGGLKNTFAFYLNNKNCKAIYDFFENNPFVYKKDKWMIGLIYTSKKIDGNHILEIFKKYYTPGMKELYIVNSEDSIQKIFKGELDEKTIVLTPENLNELTKENNSIDLKEKNDQVKQIMKNEYKDIFLKLTKRFPDLKNSISRTLILTLRFKNHGVNIDKINEKMLEEVFSALSECKFSKEAVPMILKYIIENERADVNIAIDHFGLNISKNNDIEDIIEKIVNDKKELIKVEGWDSFNYIMGIIMKELKGKADGKIISKILKNKIEEIL